MKFSDELDMATAWQLPCSSRFVV